MLEMQLKAPNISPHLAEVYPGTWLWIRDLESENFFMGKVVKKPGQQVEHDRNMWPTGGTKQSQGPLYIYIEPSA